jgi:hypothetical protein
MAGFTPMKCPLARHSVRTNPRMPLPGELAGLPEAVMNGEA